MIEQCKTDFDQTGSTTGAVVPEVKLLTKM